ncbi:zinc-binding alcohol dehydrogenase [Oceanicella sp. SM1341]|uniref:zinc-dependent alcohol dehydrogenase n=1 Tax=Oceanicella sp. SM1341 TaxID=1548889 RepID=UPI0018E59589|nr:zinc-binding alcohol dehydrogenase [Oceanicella sp. SM1341]
MELDTRALWYEAPGRATLRPGRGGDGGVVVDTLWSALSRGTERLVFEGRVPRQEFGRMRAPAQEGDFPFPVKYGYCNVGRVRDGALAGREVFSLSPHQRGFRAAEAALSPLPEGLPARRAVLAANAETALNALWDAGLCFGEHEGLSVTVIGAGVVGCLTAALASSVARCSVTVTDRIDKRISVANELGVKFATETAPGRSDIVFNCSASAAGLAAGLEALRPEGTLVEMSWHGAEPVAVPLGGAFHSQRLRIVSSQVGMVAPRARARGIDHAARLAMALALLRDPVYDCLITGEIGFEELPQALPALLAPDAPGLVTVIRY